VDQHGEKEWRQWHWFEAGERSRVGREKMGGRIEVCSSQAYNHVRMLPMYINMDIHMCSLYLQISPKFE
jgi:hypothetical protein